MHELTIAQEIVRVVRESLSAGEVSRVKQINLLIGDLTAVQEECLKFCIDAVTRETPLSGVSVNIRHIEPRFRCRACGEEYSSDNPFYLPCPRCKTFGADLIAGNELSVTSVDLHQGAEDARTGLG
jgi:hydrogenase nickel incorporation protein HypA/HybF